MSKIRFVGLDVHAETIAVAVAESGGDVRSLGIIANDEQSVSGVGETGSSFCTAGAGVHVVGLCP